ncbi:MAG: GTP pyrophosphokinase family protein [Lachnospiraceae bacterium]|nr:GTP pyrophosphokinase family protein [Lachnospiraceae bacterium]
MEIQLWREILGPYDLAVRELVVKFEHLISEYRNQGLYSPIEQVTGRVKSIASILDKAQKKNVTAGEVEEKILDIAGVRIICQFVEDIQKVVEIIRARTDMEIVSERDYVSHMKDSGYRSYHIIVLYEVQTVNGSRKIHVEIQIRTLAMNFWSTIEHSLQYKYKKNIPEHISEKLMNVANATISLDNEMSSVRSEIMDAQISSQLQTRLVADILNNIQNLYRVTTKREVQKIQDEFYRIYELNDIDQLRRFGRELDLIAEGYRVQSVETEEV